MYHCAVFDMDGTILDTLTDVTNSLNWALEKHGLPTHTQDEVRHMVGNGVQHLVESAVPEGTPNDVVAAVLADNKEHYAAHCNDTTKPYPGIMELLQHLKAAGVKLAVVSNKPDNAVQDLVRDVFNGIFDVALGQKDDIPRKPNPEMVYLALKQLSGADCEDSSFAPDATSSQPDPKAVYIGDSEVDIKTAENAHLPVLLVLWGFRTKQELEEAGGQIFFTNTQELGRALLED